MLCRTLVIGEEERERGVRRMREECGERVLTWSN
jgi:hypothetical protein